MASVPHSWFSCIISSSHPPPPPPPPPFTIYFCAKRLKSQRNNLPIQSFCESKCRSFTCLCVFQCAFTVVRIFVASGLWCTSLVWVAYGVSLRGVQPLLMKTDDRGPDPLPVSTAVHTWVSFVCCVKHSRCSSSISFISFLYNLSFIVISETWRCKKNPVLSFFSIWTYRNTGQHHAERKPSTWAASDSVPTKRPGSRADAQRCVWRRGRGWKTPKLLCVIITAISHCVYSTLLNVPFTFNPSPSVFPPRLLSASHWCSLSKCHGILEMWSKFWPTDIHKLVLWMGWGGGGLP